MFRKAALAKLSSPEQLDSLMQVTTPKGWLALAGVIVLILGGVTWGFLGRTAERISGAGILLREGGIFAIESRGTGIVEDVLVNVGDEVEKGQAVVRVSQPEVEQELHQNEALLAELRGNSSRSAELIERSRDAELKALVAERGRLAKDTEALANRISFLETRLKAQSEAADQGLITRDVREATAQELDAARSTLIAQQAQRAQLEAREAQVRNTADQSGFGLEQAVRRTERQIEQIRRRLAEGTQVLAPYPGKIVSRLVDAGQEVRQGAPVLFIELSNRPLRAVAFIPLQGARIRPGMTAQMSPEGITWEEYGYMLGDVISVTQGPVNPDSMNRILRNPQLVQQFTSAGSVYEMRIMLRRDAATPSGFSWTSRQGPPIKFGSGTLFRVQIPVDEKRPIELVIPTLRRWIGV
jgi:HlyD family secretion protein